MYEVWYLKLHLQIDPGLFELDVTLIVKLLQKLLSCSQV